MRTAASTFVLFKALDHLILDHRAPNEHARRSTGSFRDTPRSLRDVGLGRAG